MALPDPIDSLDKWLEELGYTSANDGAAEGVLTPLMCAVIAKRLEFVRELLERGIYVAAIRPPTVPEGTSRLRLSVMATHEESQLERAAEALIEAVKVNAV